MTEEKFDAMMKNYQGIGVETENGQRYFYEAFGGDFEGAVKRVNDTFSGQKFGKYKVFIARSEETERMVNIRDEEVVIYKTKEGDVVAVLENQAIRVYESVVSAISMLYRAGFIVKDLEKWSVDRAVAMLYMEW